MSALGVLRLGIGRNAEGTRRIERGWVVRKGGQEVAALATSCGWLASHSPDFPAISTSELAYLVGIATPLSRPAPQVVTEGTIPLALVSRDSDRRRSRVVSISLYSSRS